MLMSGFCYKQKHAHHSPEMRNQTRIIIIVFGEKKTKEFIGGGGGGGEAKEPKCVCW